MAQFPLGRSTEYGIESRGDQLDLCPSRHYPSTELLRLFARKQFTDSGLKNFDAL